MDLSLRGVPTIISSNNDGNAIARSAEAKALGIKMGDPIFKIRDIIEKHGIAVRSSNYTLYADMQQRVLAAIEPFVLEQEIYSIDELCEDEHNSYYEQFDFMLSNLSTALKFNVLNQIGLV